MVCKEAMDTEYPQLEEEDNVENIFKVIREENIGNVPIVQRGPDGYKLKVTRYYYLNSWTGIDTQIALEGIIGK
jgi:hypothetical protein